MYALRDSFRFTFSTLEDPSMDESSKEDHPLDLLEDHKYHTVQAVNALEGVIRAMVEAGVVDPEALGKLVDHIYKVNQDYRKLAVNLVPEEQYPDRATRWPDFFPAEEEQIG